MVPKPAVHDFEGVVTGSPRVLSCQLKDDGGIPNSPLPLIIYHQAFRLLERDPAAVIERVFAANHWANSWRNGIYSYHHYHSNAHEVLGVFSGWASVRFGGERGATERLEAGDVVIIPAGVAHKNLGASSDFGVVGAYPGGQEPDMCYGRPGERPQADANLRQVAAPACDPIYGPDGHLFDYWPRR